MEGRKEEHVGIGLVRFGEGLRAFEREVEFTMDRGPHWKHLDAL